MIKVHYFIQYSFKILLNYTTKMSSVHHHDQSRNKVGSTAFGVAKSRNIETNRPDGLIRDPFAKLFASDDLHTFLEDLSSHGKDNMVTGIAVRTRIIDELMVQSLPNIQQIVVLGAGLDCRPWRLNSYFTSEEQAIQYQSMKYFEIEFQEVFDYKLHQLKDQQPCFDYNPIDANVCVDNWTDALVTKGFDPSKPTFWLLEGFTGYLTPEELQICLNNLRKGSTSGSKLIATFLGKAFGTYHDMHRFRTDEPIEYLLQWGWEGKMHQMIDLCELFGRSGEDWQGYYLVDMTLP